MQAKSKMSVSGWTQIKIVPEGASTGQIIVLFDVHVLGQVPVVQRVGNAIHQINHYPVDSIVCFVNSYPLDSELSSG